MKRLAAWLLSLVFVLAVLPMQAFAYSVNDTPYAVTGGNIYFDKATGEITKCDEQVTEAIIPEIIDGVKVTKIGIHAFHACEQLVNVTIPEGVTEIGEYAFCGCSHLKNVEIPGSVMSMGDSIFYNCSQLENVVLPEGITNIADYVFKGCSSLQSIVIPEGVTNIGWFIFEDCSSLKTITIPG